MIQSSKPIPIEASLRGRPVPDINPGWVGSIHTDQPSAALLIAGPYPDYLDRQLLLATVQMDFDYADPATVAPYVLNAPLPGVPKKQLLAQMSVNDD